MQRIIIIIMSMMIFIFPLRKRSSLWLTASINSNNRLSGMGSLTVFVLWLDNVPILLLRNIFIYIKLGVTVHVLQTLQHGSFGYIISFFTKCLLYKKKGYDWLCFSDVLLLYYFKKKSKFGNVDRKIQLFISCVMSEKAAEWRENYILGRSQCVQEKAITVLPVTSEKQWVFLRDQSWDCFGSCYTLTTLIDRYLIPNFIFMLMMLFASTPIEDSYQLQQAFNDVQHNVYWLVLNAN